MAVSVGLQAKARTIVGVEGWPYRAVADAMEVIPRTLVQNSGGNAIRVLTELRVSALSLFYWLALSTHTLSGKTCQRRTLLGSQRRDWQDCRHEDVWSLRVCQRESEILPSDPYVRACSWPIPARSKPLKQPSRSVSIILSSYEYFLTCFPGCSHAPPGRRCRASDAKRQGAGPEPRSSP